MPSPTGTLLPLRPVVTAPLSELLGCAGLPAAIHRSSPERDSREWDRLVGTHVHRVIADLAPRLRDIPAPDLGDAAIEAAGRLVGDRRIGNVASARGRVAGMASAYLQRLAPPPGTAFLGAEVPAPSGGVAGRVDLAWSHPSVGVFYDELKSWRQVLAAPDPDTLDQVNRYLDAGIAAHGDRFAGVRVVTLAALASSLWVDRDGTVSRLAGSPGDPSSLATPTRERGAA